MVINWFIPETGLSLSKFRKICGLSSYNYNKHLASVWIRCLQIIPLLDHMGVKSLINAENVKTDIAIFLRRHDTKVFNILNKQKGMGAKIVMDLCVNFFDVTGLFPGGYGSEEKVSNHVKKLVSQADVIICSSDYIRKKASEYHSWAIYIPDSINYEHFRWKKSKRDFEKSKLSAIWSGQSTKSVEISEFYFTLKERGIPLTIISNKKPDMPGSYNYIPWSYYTFPKNIVKGDFCISPRRTDNTYDLGHSHFKIGVFMAQGVPALAAPLPSYREVIGKTGGGRICETDLQWEEALDEVLENRVMLWEWSQAAHDGMDYYSTENITKNYVEIFEKLISEEKMISI